MRQFVCMTLALALLTVGCKQDAKKTDDKAQKPATKEQTAPTEKPTEAPAAAKVDEPAAEPTAEKAAEPTAEKAAEPTAEKAAEPTAQPGAEVATAEADPVAPTAAETAPSADSKAGHFGGEFTLTDSQKLEDVLAKASDFTGKNIRIEAKVARVCKKKGCWFTIQPEANSGEFVRVTMKDYGFFVPKDCDGKKAVVEGVFTSVELSEGARKHLADDAGDDPKTVVGPARELTLVATAIDIVGQ